MCVLLKVLVILGFQNKDFRIFVRCKYLMRFDNMHLLGLKVVVMRYFECAPFGIRNIDFPIDYHNNRRWIHFYIALEPHQSKGEKPS